MKEISIKGIILGILCALSLSFMTGIGLAFAFLDTSLAQHSPKAAVAATLHSTPYLVACIADGLLISAFGGHIAARIAQGAHFLHAGLVGVAFIVIRWLAIEDEPLWFNTTAFVLTIPASLLGGYLAWLRKASAKGHSQRLARE